MHYAAIHNQSAHEKTEIAHSNGECAYECLSQQELSKNKEFYLIPMRNAGFVVLKLRRFSRASFEVKNYG